MPLATRSRLALVLALAAVAAVVAPSQAAAPRAGYVVTLAPSVLSPQAVADLTKPLGGTVGFVYTHALKGFSVTLPVAALPALRLLPGVSAVEPDGTLRVDATQVDPPSYGLDRIDARSGLDGRYTSRHNGRGVTAYVIDTGVYYGHSDFGGRARPGFDAVTKGGRAADCNGHGTHVAGTIGGALEGVAKGVRLVGVRVLGCDGSGPTSGVIAGVDWVAGHAVQPAVANMSLGGSADAALDQAVSGAIAKGITFGVAAGNDGSLLNDLLGSSDACTVSPARVPTALTVAATDASDARASYSNRGRCVDLWAPGSDITSDWYTSPAATAVLSGTSMATPHVVGVAALYLSTVGRRSPAQVAAALTSTATQGVVTGAGPGTTDRLLFERY